MPRHPTARRSFKRTARVATPAPPIRARRRPTSFVNGRRKRSFRRSPPERCGRRAAPERRRTARRRGISRAGSRSAATSPAPARPLRCLGARADSARHASVERLVAGGRPTRDFKPRQQAGLTAEQRAAAHAEVGVRLSRCHVGLVAADRRRRPPVRRQPERHGLRARREERLHLLDVHGEERRAHGVTVGSQRATATRVYFGDTGANVYALDAATGRRTLVASRSTIIPTRASPASPTLYQGSARTCRCRRSRKPPPASRATSAARSAAASNALDAQDRRGRLAGRSPCRRRSRSERTPTGVDAVGTVGRRHLVGADHRRQARLVYVGHRQHLQRAGAADRRRDHRVRSGERRDQVDQAVDRRRRLRLPAPAARTAARRRDRISTSARRRCSSRWPTAATSSSSAQKSGMTYATRSRQAGRGALAVSRRPRIDLGRHPVGRRGRSASSAYFPVSDIRTPKPGGLHAVKLATGERAWYLPPPPLTCAAGTDLQRRADLGADAHSRRAVLGLERRRAARVLDQGRLGHLGASTPTASSRRSTAIKAGGGSIQGPGPTIAGGMLYLNSGYGDHSGRPGTSCWRLKCNNRRRRTLKGASPTWNWVSLRARSGRAQIVQFRP